MTVTQRQKDKILDKLVEALELPDTAYQKAEARYTDLGDWFSREESSIRDFSPHIFAQGSFRLGTAIRPLNEAEEYDLDLACKLTQNASMSSLTQEEVKNLVGNETEQYRRKRKISKEQEEKHRCWRLEY
ncbi:MAG: nucleotidyltransferase, partial [Schleiferiaceae bacterium]|nr:nucleotidyltransferase [Schleiferiaceae bacterium]